MENNKYGVCEWVLPVVGPEAVVFAAKAGFDGIQLADAGGEKESFPLTRKRIQQEYLEAIENTGIKFQGLNLYTLVRQGTMKYPLLSAEGIRAKTSILMGIRACAEMEIPVLFLTSGMACQIENENDFTNTAEMFRIACDAGADNGVTVVFESILSVRQILRMIDTVGEQLRICYDIYNPIRFGTADPLDEIEQLCDVVDHYHLKDAPENNIGCALLGEGRGHFFDTAYLIKKCGYRGWYVSENYYAQPPMSPDGDPAEFAKKDLATMQRLFDPKQQ